MGISVTLNVMLMHPSTYGLENFKHFFPAEITVSVLLEYSLWFGFADAFILFQQHLYLLVILNLIPA
jgi:hypothetical protein